jgi:hypothetical protein
MTYFNFWNLLNAIVNSIVLLGLPGSLMTYVAWYGVGILSDVYRRSSVEKLKLEERITGVSARMAGYSQCFRALTDQVATPVAEMKGMKMDLFENHINDVFHRFIGEGGLTQKELHNLATFLHAQLDVTQTGTVDYFDFIKNCAENEPIHMKVITDLFNASRKPWILERLLNDTPFVNVTKYSDRLERQDSGRRAKTSSLSDVKKVAPCPPDVHTVGEGCNPPEIARWAAPSQPETTHVDTFYKHKSTAAPSQPAIESP